MPDFPTLAKLAEELDSGRTTSRKLVEACLAKIADPAGEGRRAFIHVDKDAALAAADAMDGLRKFKAAGYVLIATTNQPGLSTGTLARRELDRMHEMLRRCLPLDDVLVCPHTESDDCTCRKPEPGLLTEAAFKWHLDLERSFVISDKWQDAKAARAAGQSQGVGRALSASIRRHASGISSKVQ